MVEIQEVEMQPTGNEVDVKETTFRHPGDGLDNRMAICLPESIYTALMMLPSCSNLTTNKTEAWLLYVQLLFCHFINLTLQGMLLAYVWEIYVEVRGELGYCGNWETTKHLRWICILIYVSYCLADIAETLQMWTFVYNFPRAEAREPIRYGVTINTETDEEILVYESGFTKCQKIYMFLCILIPKFGMACTLIALGTGFVVTTDDDADLILNALALGFVLDLDELMYQTFCSFNMRRMVEEFPPVYIHDGRLGEIMGKKCGVFVKCIGIVAITTMTYRLFCADYLMDYNCDKGLANMECPP